MSEFEDKLSDYIGKINENITFIESPFYPDFMPVARGMYRESFDLFYNILEKSNSSEELLRNISKERGQIRMNLLKIFRRLVSPDTSVEMLKRQGKLEETIKSYGYKFRDIGEVKDVINSYKGENSLEVLELPLMALMNETQNRGKSGYILTDMFFEWFERRLGVEYSIEGPRQAGKDIQLKDVLEGYPEDSPTDFVIRRKSDKSIVAIGYARYDSDRGGSQEDDRVSGNRDKITKLKEYKASRDINNIKIIFLNDGPGITLGSMFLDYINLEEHYGQGFVKVVTFKMLDSRITKEWLES